MVKKTKNITLKTIAKECNLSITAVSSILSKNDKYKASQTSRDLVFAVAEKMNYKPNRIARSLVTKKFNTIGLLFHSIHDRCYSEIMASISKRLTHYGYTTIFAFWGESGFDKALELLLNHGVDGIISSATEISLENKEIGVPIVLYGTESQHNDAVIIKRGVGLQKLLCSLHNQGYRKFSYIGNVEAEPRYKAFLDFLDTYSLEKNDNWVWGLENSLELRENAMKEILNSNNYPEIVVAQNDISAMALMSICINYGLKVPEDIGFIGFDNLRESRYAVPALTTLDIKIDYTSDCLITLLLRRLEKNDAERMVIEVIPEIIYRNSVKLL